MPNFDPSAAVVEYRPKRSTLCFEAFDLATIVDRSAGCLEKLVEIGLEQITEPALGKDQCSIGRRSEQ